MTQRRAAVSWLHGAALLAGLAFGAAALAAQPWIAVPSAVSGNKVSLAGGALAAWQPLTIQVTDPQGRSSQLAATTDAKGGLAVELAADAKGTHRVDVFNAAGERIGGGSFIITR